MAPHPPTGGGDVRGHLTAAAVAITVCTLGALDVRYSGTHRGIMVGLAVIPAFGLLLPRRGLYPLLPGTLALCTALLLGIAEWHSRPLVVLFTLVDIVVLTYVVRRIGSWQLARPAADSADTSEPGKRERKPAEPGSWQAIGLRGEYRRLPDASADRTPTDFHDVRQSPYGVRLLVADLAGKSDETRAAADDLRHGWRRHAVEAAGLAELAARLDAEFAGHSETFAKVLLMNVSHDGKEVDIVSCGHEPPYLLSGGSVNAVEFLSAVPPVGLFSLAAGGVPVYVTKVSLTPGRRLLVLTDGVTGALDPQGRPFPLADHVLALDGREPSTFVDELTERLHRHRGDAPRDEALLLLVESDEALGGRHTDARTREDAAAA
ncbi:serine/threonine-protein phosphatase [Streptomyces sp. TRM66268-LWL]|uniref:Serine/threonine-protein phosphatase n=1 Tax=Streptomyces polyasparticus TaxID=2767826 RepID=A0ABR7SHW0_9ACTN|nr:PP2C family protein-serine/threonine phosphatase [Streptomyces polyasparticus]MBC9715072.1 serine/threonine-protein phosphatase [Streptomyces polyasparticus]